MKIAISFSGGRTSAVMTQLIIQRYPKAEILVLFANTGCEHPKTLDFVQNCDVYWNFKTIWLEAKIDLTPNIGIRHNLVSYETASREGKPFRDVIEKYGIPNPSFPHCSSRLKAEVMESYLRNYGWNVGEKSRNYYTAIGIRPDEIDRMSEKWKELKLWYPLIDWGFYKGKINAYMKQQPFDLELPGDHYGNCVFCWKKSFRKLATIAQDDPCWFDFPKEMEGKYRHFKPPVKQGERTFYRKHRDTQWLLDLAQSENFKRYEDSGQQTIWDGLKIVEIDELDIGGNCNDGCEVY